MADEDRPWYVQLLLTLVLLVGGAVLLCVVVGVMGVGTALVLGFHPGSSGSTATISAVTASPTPGSSSNGPGGPQATSTAGARQLITLTATPQQVPVYGRIDLHGRYAAPAGTTLQVQRQQPGTPWRDFPTKTTLSAGSFSTYIKTGHTGVNRLRVIDVQRSVISNVVTVRVG